MIKILLKAGSPVDATSNDSRTALYLAAEFSPTVEPLRLLIQAGATADVCNAHGNHIVTNAMREEVQKFLSVLTGHPLPAPRVEIADVKLNAPEWRKAKLRIDEVFDALSRSGLVVLQDAGTTQEDGFSDCAEEFQARGGFVAGLLGFCFYTRQDLSRAKRTSQLLLAFWGAPDGAPDSMLRVGQQVVAAFRENGFAVDWNGSSSMRPTVHL
ncbi:MAG: ankyrin repeat domain-containing protein [Prosthecobacter sp.]